MSNRSLIEFNHDYAGTIIRDPEGFMRSLGAYLSSIDSRTKEMLRPYGVRVFGSRHHSEGFDIEWGHHKSSEQKSSRA